ncbi:MULTISPECIES: FkbM family methyltransferase [Leptolyngbya]|uniref:FkbM family methyltransferase n=1 Tax=Leptolyngbya TaxID=47251 RepID=UPI001687B419|nr:FkbM family methyltransferase [Leptolyngbya sp. FACHB-1624]MBD1858320.1 FkbM family methyltransferase [Leptolyngbya sp. FACHB-1624]
MLRSIVRNSIAAPLRALPYFRGKYRLASALIPLLTDYQNEQDCLVVDIEGAELEFLRGGQKFLATHRPIIYGEFNPDWCQQFGYSFLDVAEFFSSWNYHFYQQIGRDCFIPVQTITPTLQDVLLIPAETSVETLAKLGVKG